MKLDKKVIGENIWRRKMVLGMDNDTLGKLLGVGRSAVSKWECGTHAPTKDKLRKLATVLQCSMHDLTREYIIPVIRYSNGILDEIVEEENVLEEPEFLNKNLVIPKEPEPIEEPVQEPIKQETKSDGSLTERINTLYDSLFETLEQLDSIKEEIGKLEKIGTLLKEIKGL